MLELDSSTLELEVTSELEDSASREELLEFICSELELGTCFSELELCAISLELELCAGSFELELCGDVLELEFSVGVLELELSARALELELCTDALELCANELELDLGFGIIFLGCTHRHGCHSSSPSAKSINVVSTVLTRTIFLWDPLMLVNVATKFEVLETHSVWSNV